jgi:hypothetical protein
MTRLAKAAAFLAANAPEKILKNFRPDCCIAATNVALKFLGQLEFSTLPQVTQLAVYTMPLWKRVADGTYLPPMRDGEWSVGSGFGEDPRKDPEHERYDPTWAGFAGHLVALASEKDETFLVDLSFGQVSRPAKGMTLPNGIACKLHDQWPAVPAGFNINGCRVNYRGIKNSAFVLAPDWMDTKRTDPIVEELLKEYQQ